MYLCTYSCLSATCLKPTISLVVVIVVAVVVVVVVGMITIILIIIGVLITIISQITIKVPLISGTSRGAPFCTCWLRTMK